MTSQSNRRGRFGEDYAAAWLKGRGAQLLERNWRCPLGEIDIIARMGDFLCFIEVKTRFSAALGAPEEAVGRGKRRRIAESAQHYLLSHPKAAELQPRFDLASVILEKGREEVLSFSYLPGAFTCDDL
ncbi:MAG: YraN family protein [Provencibacterium sp.]|jgi:putative endonuclease|nr:YraN family protein [Provencibacterium sp.]